MRIRIRVPILQKICRTSLSFMSFLDHYVSINSFRMSTLVVIYAHDKFSKF